MTFRRGQVDDDLYVRIGEDCLETLISTDRVMRAERLQPLGRAVIAPRSVSSG